MDMEDFSIIVFCAFRYALGRMTYINIVVTNFIMKNIDKVLTKHIYLMIHEVEEFNEEHGSIGASFDTSMWFEFKIFLEGELEKRENGKTM